MVKKKKVDGKLVVTKKIFGNKEDTQEAIEVDTFPEEVETATVSFSRSKFVNLDGRGDGSIFVSITLPCYVEQVDECLDFIVGKVKRRISFELIELKKDWI